MDVTAVGPDQLDLCRRSLRQLDPQWALRSLDAIHHDGSHVASHAELDRRGT